MKNKNSRRGATMRKATLALLALLIAVVAIGATAGMGAATHDATNSIEYHNNTIAVDNNTQSVYIDVQDTNGTTVHGFIYGIDADGVETEVANGDLTALEGETDSLETPADPATYDEYRFVVEGDETTDEPAEIVSGTIAKLDGGGGPAATLGSSIYGVPVWIALLGALGIGALVLGGGNKNGY